VHLQQLEGALGIATMAAMLESDVSDVSEPDSFYLLQEPKQPRPGRQLYMKEKAAEWDAFTSQQRAPYELDGHKYLGAFRLYEEELQEFEQAGGVSRPKPPSDVGSEGAWEKYSEQNIKHTHFERRRRFKPTESPPPDQLPKPPPGTGSAKGMFMKEHTCWKEKSH